MSETKLTPTDLDRLEELERRATAKGLDELCLCSHPLRAHDGEHGCLAASMCSHEVCSCEAFRPDVDRTVVTAELTDILPALIAAHRQALARVERLEGALRDAKETLVAAGDLCRAPGCRQRYDACLRPYVPGDW